MSVSYLVTETVPPKNAQLDAGDRPVSSILASEPYRDLLGAGQKLTDRWRPAIYPQVSASLSLPAT